MPLKDTCDLVDRALGANHHILPLAVAALLPEARARGVQEGKRFGNDEHQTTYVPGDHHEMQVWYISLMLAEYLADLLGRKVRDGHCNAQGPGHVPCATMRAEHLRMLQEYRQALEKLVEDVKKLEGTL